MTKWIVYDKNNSKDNKQKGETRVIRKKKLWLPVLTAALLFATDLTANASMGVGEIDGIFIDFPPYPGFKTHYVGKTNKKTPVKKLVKVISHDPTNTYVAEAPVKYNKNGDIVEYNNNKYKYNKDGNVVYKNSGSNQNKYEYDDKGNLIHETVYNKDGAYGQIDYIVKKNRIVKQKASWALVGHSTPYVTRFKYDKNGNLTKETCLYSSTTYTYDATGKLLTEHIDRGSNKPLDYEFKYDADGYVIQKIQHHYSDEVDCYYEDFIYE